MQEVDGTVIIEDLSRRLIDLPKIARRSMLGHKIGQYNGCHVVDINFNGEAYVTLMDGSEVLYFVEHVPVKKELLSFGRQVLVWRNQGAPEAAGFAQHVFFDMLLPRYKALISDVMQTRNGQSFWQYALQHALRKGHHCYFLDNRVGQVLHPLLSVQDVVKFKYDIWGKTKDHQNTFAVISTKDLM